jgi:hypothetical protein
MKKIITFMLGCLLFVGFTATSMPNTGAKKIFKESKVECLKIQKECNMSIAAVAIIFNQDNSPGTNLVNESKIKTFKATSYKLNHESIYRKRCKPILRKRYKSINCKNYNLNISYNWPDRINPCNFRHGNLKS